MKGQLGQEAERLSSKRMCESLGKVTQLSSPKKHNTTTLIKLVQIALISLRSCASQLAGGHQQKTE